MERVGTLVPGGVAGPGRRRRDRAGTGRAVPHDQPHCILLHESGAGVAFGQVALGRPAAGGAEALRSLDRRPLPRTGHRKKAAVPDNANAASLHLVDELCRRRLEPGAGVGWPHDPCVEHAWPFHVVEKEMPAADHVGEAPHGRCRRVCAGRHELRLEVHRNVHIRLPEQARERYRTIGTRAEQCAVLQRPLRGSAAQPPRGDPHRLVPQRGGGEAHRTPGLLHGIAARGHALVRTRASANRRDVDPVARHRELLVDDLGERGGNPLADVDLA